MKITSFLDARKFEDQLRAMPKNIRKEVRRDIRTAAEIVASAARSNAPKGDTLRLSNSIIVRQAQYTRGRIENDLMMEVHVNAPYAGYVEYGINQPQNKFWFRRSVIQCRSLCNQIVKQAIRKGLQNTVNSSGISINGKNLGFLDAVTLG